MYSLHTSIKKGNEYLATLLLESGASPNQKDDNNKYPIELANEAKMIKLEPVLLQFKSMSLFEINLPKYIGFWKESKDSPDRVLEIIKDNVGGWYMVVFSGVREETIQILPESNAFIPVSKTAIKALNGNFTKISNDEFEVEKEKLGLKQSAIAQAEAEEEDEDEEAQQSSSIPASTSTDSNSLISESSSLEDSKPSLLSNKMDSIIGVWKRVPPFDNETHNIRYIFIHKYKYSSINSWDFKFVSKRSPESVVLKEEDLELIDNAIATLKRAALDTYYARGGYKTRYVTGYNFKLNSLDSFNVKYLDHNNAKILNEEFRRISPNELEEEYLEYYNIVVN